MDIVIRKYNAPQDYSKITELIKAEGEEWNEYLAPAYRKPLEESVTYVAYSGEHLCGYIRSINDSGFFVWIIDLLVDKDYRGNSIGKRLMEHILSDFPNQDVFVMSDNDGYYQRLGYTKEGSIFKVE